MSITKKYGETVHSKIPPYFATFPPVTDVSAGDVGVLIDGVFQRLDSTLALGLDLSSKRSTGLASQFSITSGNDVSVSTQVDGGAVHEGPDAYTELKIQFEKKDGFFLAAADCHEQSIENELSVHNNIIDMFMKKSWKPEWYFVRSVTKVESLTLLTSSEGGAEVTFRGRFENDANEAKYKLNAGLKVASRGSFGSEIIGTSGSPLVKLMAVRRKFLTGEPVPRIDLMAPENFAALENARRQCIYQGTEPYEFFHLREIDENDTLF